MRFLFLIILLIPVTAFSKPSLDLHSSVNCLLEPVVKLAADQRIIKRVTDYNKHPANIDAMERDWPSLTAGSEFIQNLVNAPAAKTLLHFIQNISAQGEGFVIGLNGGLAAATNKTSDFWQGDEAQFTEAINLQVGETKVFEPAVDQSAATVVVKISSPIYSPEEKKNIGVLVVGFDAIVLDFLQLCEN